MKESITNMEQQIFHKELKRLKKHNYISKKIYEVVDSAYLNFYDDLQKIETIVPEKVQEDTIESVSKENVKEAELSKPLVKKTFKKRSPEEVRERNITWLLNIGVFLLLIGGLFVATSQWDTMSGLLRTSSIGAVSLLFFTLSFIAQKFLKISRSAFAFHVLASLFLPIILLSAGWFELFGSYFSVLGEGRFWFGSGGALLLFPVYMYFAKSLQSRFYVWFSYIALSFFASFFLAACQLSRDAFFLGMLLFHMLLIIAYHRVKKQEKYKLFTAELVYYVQIQFIVSSLFMASLFESHIFAGINGMIAAGMYLALIYVSGRKEYHFVFTIFTLYGLFQVIEFSILDAWSPVLLVVAAGSFLFIPKLLPEKHSWDNVFRITAGAVSFLGFFYSLAELVLAGQGQPSIILSLSFVILFGLHVYLANAFNKTLYTYIPPLFAMAAMFEMVRIGEPASYLVPIFLIGAVICLLFGFLNKHSFFRVIQNSSRDAGFIVMFYTAMMGLTFQDHSKVALMLILLTVILGISHRQDERKFYQQLTPWVIPVSFGMAIIAACEAINSASELYHDHLGIAVSFAIGGGMLLILSKTAERYQIQDIAKIAYAAAVVIYSTAILLSYLDFVYNQFVQPAILLTGLLIYWKYYKKCSYKWIPFIIPIVMLLSYFSMLNIFVEDSPVILARMQYTIGGVILLLAAVLLKKDHCLAAGFAWIGHLFLPFALSLTYIAEGKLAIDSFLLAVAIYFMSSRMTRENWKVKVFLYSCFISSYGALLFAMDLLNNGQHKEFLPFIISIAVYLLWQFGRTSDQKHINWFLIPWSVFGILNVLLAYPNTFLYYSVILAYAAAFIFYLFKSRFYYLASIPLFLSWAGTLQFILLHVSNAGLKQGILAAFAVSLALSGMWVYKKYKQKAAMFSYSDPFLLGSLLFALSLYLFQSDAIIFKMAPGLLISGLIILMRTRFKGELMWIPAVISLLWLIQPYYSFIGYIHIPTVFMLEVQVLPLVLLVILGKMILKGRYRSKTNKLQWFVLIAVSFLLIEDGLQSSTVMDAIILGTLSLLSILGGFYFKIKVYFFVGCGVLLLNVLLQTRPFWGNMPWWAYLLLAGTILISVASYHEWQKQQKTKGKETVFITFKNWIMRKLKEWN